jgi:hypothetical protein
MEQQPWRVESWTFYLFLGIAAILGGAVSAGRPGAGSYCYRLFASSVAGFFAAIGAKAYFWQTATLEAYCVIAAIGGFVGLHAVSGLDAFATEVERDPSRWLPWRKSPPSNNSNEGK